MVNPNRSYVICHMMTTLDGKIDSGIKGQDILGDYYNLYSQLEHELKPQAWMCGRVTSAMYAESISAPLPASNKTIDFTDFKSSMNVGKFMIAVDTKGVLRWKSNTLTFGDKSVHQLIVCVTDQTPIDYLAYLQSKNISYIHAGKQDVDFSTLFQKLKKDFQIDTLALEGGGILNGSVMAADLIDEISLLMTPLVLNRSTTPSIFERKTQQLQIKHYKLFEVKQMEKDSVWLRYKKP